MYRHIIEEHANLEQGQTLKIFFTRTDSETYLNRTDKVTVDGKVLRVDRKNGAKVFINTRQIVMFCVIKEMWR